MILIKFSALNRLYKMILNTDSYTYKINFPIIFCARNSFTYFLLFFYTLKVHPKRVYMHLIKYLNFILYLIWFLWMIYNLINWNKKSLPKASKVLDSYLRQERPHWTAFFVKYKDIQNDQFTQTCFIHKVDDSEYLILRTGCFPFIKYHCSRINKTEYDIKQIEFQDKFFGLIKLMNFGRFILKK